MTATRFEFSRVIVLWLLAATIAVSQKSPNLQSFTERFFGQRAPEVFRVSAQPPRFLVAFSHIRSVSTDLNAALATSCNIFHSLCIINGRFRTNAVRNICSAATQRCIDSIPRSVQRADFIFGSIATSTTASTVTSTNLAHPTTSTTTFTNAATNAASSSITGTATITTGTAANLAQTTASVTTSTNAATTPSLTTGTATITTGTAANLVQPTPSGTNSSSTTVTATSTTGTAAISTSATANATSTSVSTANLVGPSPAAEVPPSPLVIPNMSQFCAQVNQGNAIADGTQKRTSTCSQTVQGQIPSFERMVSTLILQPENGAVIQRGSTVAFTCTTSNMETGFFDDPSRLYYASPQTLNSEGIIQGHQHITIQRIASSTVAPDPRSESLSFFVGLNSRANEQGIHTATIPATAFTLPGIYRICTITGTRGHQPVIMPVARRGSQDDCIRVNVV